MSHLLPPVIVHSLICRAHVAMGIQCLSTLFRTSDHPVDLRLHDDGSLTSEDKVALRAAFPTARLISREEGEQLASEQLRSFPRCLEFHRDCCMAIKLFDPLLMGREPYLLLDTDILFFQPFEDLFAAPKDCAVLYMKDYVYSYALTPWDMIAHPDLRAVRGLNAGMLYVQPAQVDLAYIEHLLRTAPGLTSGVLGEQTIWAILANKLGARKWNPRQVSIVNQDFQASPDQIAAHFVSPSRSRLQEFTDQGAIANGATGQRVRAETEKTDRYTSVGTMSDYAKRTVHNRLHQMRARLRSR